jgi:hypothetical protein
MAEVKQAINETEKLEAEQPEKLSGKISVKNISRFSVYLTYGEIKSGEIGLCSPSDLENFLGSYLEKA